MECREAMAAEVLGAAVYAPFRPAPTVLTSGGWGLPSGGGGGGPPVGEVPPEEDEDPDGCDRSPACLDDLVGTAMVGPAGGSALSVFLPGSYQRKYSSELSGPQREEFPRSLKPIECGQRTKFFLKPFIIPN